MADDSELDHIRTFLGKVHTAATVKQITEAGTIISQNFNDTQRMLVLPGELISVLNYTYVKRYKIQVSETTEANLTSALSNIIEGIYKLNTRQTITDYTRPSTLLNIVLVNSTKTWYNVKTTRWDCDIFLDIEWSTS